MKHDIQVADFPDLGEPMAEAIEKCVHCGFCLPACPTYQLLGQEMDSPRGRIVLMKEVLEGNLEFETAQPHVDACLGCLACETACPSGVPYRDLISPYRANAKQSAKRSIVDRLRVAVVSHTLPYPRIFRRAIQMGKFARSFKPLLPKTMQAMLDMLPDQLPRTQSLPNKVAARGTMRARVALLTGCAQQVLAPDINLATIEVLTRNGVEVVLPKSQACCGSLDWHLGNVLQAQRFAKHNVAAFPTDVDAIVTNAAGCGTGMQEYGLILRGTPQQSEAADFAKRVCDVAVFLDRIGLQTPIPEQRSARIVYQDACHLLHGQGAAAAPRRLLKKIPGLELVNIPEAELCCGSAGTYNIDQPKIARQLGARKTTNILSVEPDAVASGNIGCITQLEIHIRKRGLNLPVRHTMQIIRDAYEERPLTGRK